MSLPPLDAAFRWSRETWGDALRCTALEAHAEHLFTTRQLELRGLDDKAWRHVAASLTTPDRPFLRVKQVHGRAVRVIRAEDAGTNVFGLRPEADAIVSNAPDVLLAVQVADCVPMLVADSRLGAVAAVHAGWRGTCAGVGAATVATLAREFGSSPRDLHVACGPSIGACCYEVGDEVLEEFRRLGQGDRELARWFSRTSAGSLRLDLWAANRDQLIAAGVRREHIYLSRLCTQTHAELFDSYRVAGPRAGRMIAAIRVPPLSARDPLACPS